MFIDLAGAGKRIARFLKNHNSDYEHTREAIHFYISNLISRFQYEKFKFDDITPKIGEILAYVDELYGKGAAK
jgi:hypothetical protein